MVLSILFIIFASAAFIHLFLQNIVLPTMLLDLKLKLQTLLEEVTLLRKGYTNNVQKTILERMEERLIITLETLPHHNILEYTLFKFKHRNNKKFKYLALKDYEELKNSGIPNIMNLEMKHYRLVKKAFLVCSGISLIYYVPLILSIESIMMMEDNMDFKFIKSDKEKIAETRIAQFGKFEKKQTRNNPNKKEPELMYL